MSKKYFSLSAQNFIVLVSSYFAVVLNITFWRFICQKIEICNLNGVIFHLYYALSVLQPDNTA